MGWVIIAGLLLISFISIVGWLNRAMREAEARAAIAYQDGLNDEDVE